MKRILLLTLCLCLIVSIFSACGNSGNSSGNGNGNGDTIVVTGADFTESRLVAEIYAQLIENKTNLRVERIYDLAEAIAFQSLVIGEADVFPGYTGTALMVFLGQEVLPGTPAAEAKERTRVGIYEEFDLILMEPMGFQNTYAIAIDRQFAEENNIRTKSDLIPFTPYMSFAGEHAFFYADRLDGFYSMSDAYGFNFRNYLMVDVALKYISFGQGMVESFIAYTTDGELTWYDLALLEDDRYFFPIYYLHPIVRRETLEQFPEIGQALSVLAGVATEADMSRYNYLVVSGQMSLAQAAEEFIREFGLLD